MNIADENWTVMASLFPPGWQEMALQSIAFERLREFSSPGALLRTLLLHICGLAAKELLGRSSRTSNRGALSITLIVMATAQICLIH
jgi:hypothetical protein